jgi:hypothetical protein
MARQPLAGQPPLTLIVAIVSDADTVVMDRVGYAEGSAFFALGSGVSLGKNTRRQKSFACGTGP